MVLILILTLCEFCCKLPCFRTLPLRFRERQEYIEMWCEFVGGFLFNETHTNPASSNKKDTEGRDEGS